MSGTVDRLVIETLAASECDLIDVLAGVTVDYAARGDALQATREAAKQLIKEAIETRRENRRLEAGMRSLQSELSRYVRNAVQGRAT